MANPQIENGHAKIANEIVEALSRINLSPYESRILWVIFRKTYGWNKKMDKVPVSQISTMTGLPKQHVSTLSYTHAGNTPAATRLYRKCQSGVAGGSGTLVSYAATLE